MLCGVLCGVSVVCVQDLGAPPEPPSPEPPSAGPRKISLFIFPSPATIFILSSLSWGCSREMLVVFEAPGPSNVHVWALGMSCETPAASGPGRSGGGAVPRRAGGPGEAGPGEGGPGEGGPGEGGWQK